MLVECVIGVRRDFGTGRTWVGVRRDFWDW